MRMRLLFGEGSEVKNFIGILSSSTETLSSLYGIIQFLIGSGRLYSPPRSFHCAKKDARLRILGMHGREFSFAVIRITASQMC